MKPNEKTEPALEARRIPLAAILADPSIQQRDGGTCSEVVEEYAQAMRNGDKFPPPVVFSNNGVDYYLADGFHRLEAFRLAQRGEEIDCEVRPGNHEDALLFACSADAIHGLRRTCSDQRRAVRSVLSHARWSQCSDREIARLCRVSHTLVGKVRREPHLETTFTDADRQEMRDASAVAPDRRRTTVQRGGKRYEMNTAPIGKAGPAPSRRKKAEPGPALNSLAWLRSTPQEREAFVKAVGRSEIENVFNAIDPIFALMRGYTLELAWNAATAPERLAFAREHHDEIKTLGWQQKWR